MKAWLAKGLLFMLGGSLLETPVTPAQKVIIDTDFGVPPQDDALAVLLALASPELEILGFTTVMGNWSRRRATSDLLRVLEIAGKDRIPVFEGASMPLVHEKSEYAVRAYGEWYSDLAPPPPPGGYARKKVEEESASQFLNRAVRENPGEITIIAIGPLTNIAIALRQDPEFAGSVRQLVIMGGAFASLPDGAGNITPNAEFNFWVDPEAASIVLRSPIQMELSPLNVSRKTHLRREHVLQLTKPNTPIARLLKETMEPEFRDPNRETFMYDQVAVASLLDPTLVKTTELYVAVDISAGINYGVSVGGKKPWPGAENSRRIRVQYDLDWERFIRMFLDRLMHGFTT